MVPPTNIHDQICQPPLPTTGGKGLQILDIKIQAYLPTPLCLPPTSGHFYPPLEAVRDPAPRRDAYGTKSPN